MTAHSALGADVLPAVAERDPRLRWWREIIYVLAFYAVYSWIRNQFGSSGSFSASNASALRNAEKVIDVEKAVGLFFEEGLQQWFDGWGWFFWFWNVFYGSLHFVVTAGVMVFLYRRFPLRYQRFRSALAFTTGLALIGFATFPLMPPRLLAAGPPYGAHLDQYEFVDTLIVHGGLWSFDSGAMNAISNQWAAMPSLHIGWATWCAIAMAPVLRRRWGQIAIIAYPFLTLFAVVVTANHYWIDGLGGLLVLGCGMSGASALMRLLDRRHATAHGGDEVEGGSTVDTEAVDARADSRTDVAEDPERPPRSAPETTTPRDVG